MKRRRTHALFQQQVRITVITGNATGGLSSSGLRDEFLYVLLSGTWASAPVTPVIPAGSSSPHFTDEKADPGMLL